MPEHSISQTIFSFICSYLDQHGFPPSLREIAHGCYLSLSTVSKYLGILEAQGRIKRQPGRARGLTLTDPSA